ncbi:MAG: FAD-dependent oxidoreductase [Acidimicrobiia bacterium]|nr:MAG: FAD-dependent oxidoreductase [Acidimicrobiia bacterium]
MADRYDAVVVGAGPNGLTAAAHLAAAGRRVLVLERAGRVGGGTRTEDLTRPGFHHDVCATVVPLAVASPAFEGLALAGHGLEFVQPDLALAHPLDGTFAAVCDRDWSSTAATLGADAGAWRRTVGPLAAGFPSLLRELAGPLPHLPRHPGLLARFGGPGLLPATRLAGRFAAEPARALFAGLAAHSAQPLSRPLTSSFALLLAAAAHTVGWPVVRGGSQRLADALAGAVRAAGGEIETGVDVRSVAALPPARAVFLDTSPPDAARLASAVLPPARRAALERFRPGPAAFKVDYALAEPVPWSAPDAARAATVHVGGTAREIAGAERETAAGRHPDRPFVIVVQPSRFDGTRAPAGRHTLWAYCHVPNGSTVDMTGRIESQIERFAPGFRDVVLARHVLAPGDLERRNPNLRGGDLGGGDLSGRQVLPRLGLVRHPYRLAAGVYLCSASTPPGPGVHGMCGAAAARAALRRELRD